MFLIQATSIKFTSLIWEHYWKEFNADTRNRSEQLNSAFDSEAHFECYYFKILLYLSTFPSLQPLTGYSPDMLRDKILALSWLKNICCI